MYASANASANASVYASANVSANAASGFKEVNPYSPHYVLANYIL
jgi:hypothetical protein